MAFYIFIDGTCDTNKEYLGRENLVCIPMEYLLDGKSFYHYSDTEPSAEEFFKQLNEGKSTSTVQITPYIYEEAWRPLLKEGHDILYLAFSSALSGTCANGIMTAANLQKEFPDRKIYAIDTLSQSGGEALLLHLALKARDEGKTIDEVYQYIEDNKLMMGTYFTVDSLAHLFRGGRVSKAAAIIGTAMQLKPCLCSNMKGELQPIDKVFGRKNSLNFLVKKCLDKIDIDKCDTIVLSDADSQADAEFIMKKIHAVYPELKIIRSSIGPVIGAHSGPGTMAIFFMAKNGRNEL